MGHVAGEAEDVHFRSGSRLLAACCARAAWNSMWLGLAGFRSLDPQTLLFRKRGAGVDAVKMKDLGCFAFPRFTQSGTGRGFACLLVSYQPLARCGFRSARLIQSSAGGSGVRPERPDAVQPGGSRASDGLQHYYLPKV